MNYFVTDEVDRIKVGKDHWVDIKRRMSYGDQQKLVASYMKMEMQAGGKTPDINVDFELGSVTLLLINIKGWNLTNEKGEIAPINADTISVLEGGVATKISNEINKRNPSPKV